MDIRKTYILISLVLLGILLQGCSLFPKEAFYLVESNVVENAWEPNTIDGGYNYDGDNFSIWIQEIRAHELPSGFGSWLFPDFPALTHSFEKIKDQDTIEITAYIYYYDPASALAARNYAAAILSDNIFSEPLETEVFHTRYDHGYKINNRETYGYSRYVFHFKLTEENLQYFTLRLSDQAGEIVAQPLNYQFRFVRYVNHSFYSWGQNPKAR